MNNDWTLYQKPEISDVIPSKVEIWRMSLTSSPPWKDSIEYLFHHHPVGGDKQH